MATATGDRTFEVSKTPQSFGEAKRTDGRPLLSTKVTHGLTEHVAPSGGMLATLSALTMGNGQKQGSHPVLRQPRPKAVSGPSEAVAGQENDSLRLSQSYLPKSSAAIRRRDYCRTARFSNA